MSCVTPFERAWPVESCTSRCGRRRLNLSRLSPRQLQLAVAARQRDDDDEPPKLNKLSMIIRRKSQEINSQLEELGDDLEERLQSATQTPASPPHRLAQLIVDTVPSGRPVLLLEIGRAPGVAETSQQLGELAAAAIAAGADALAVQTCGEEPTTPEPLKDLLAVTRAAAAAVGRRRAIDGQTIQAPPPVMQRDWFIHPLQVVGAKEAGAAGIIGTIASVTSRGTPLMSSFAAAIGLDCPVEVVNMQELQALEQFRIPFFGMNISVGLSVSVSGFGLQVAKGLLGELPFGVINMVGAKSVEEAREARLAGADCLLIKWELVAQHSPDRLALLVEQLRDATCGDD